MDYDTSSKFGLRIDFDLCTSVTILSTESEDGCRLEIAYYVISRPRIWAKFGNLIQHSTQTTAIWSKSQREEFQYGSRSFFYIGSSYFSAVD